MTDTGYPHELAGDPAPPPADLDPRVLGMALKAHARHLTAAGPGLLAAAAGWPTDPRPAASLLARRDEANATAPARNKASDGMIGDARHQLDPSSDHDGWLKVAGVGVVRALDVTTDPALRLPAAAERIRARAAAGTLPQVTGGGYVILNGRITAPDFTGWRVYTGRDPHVSHMHVSTSTDPARFDDPRPWGVFSTEQPAPASMTPAPAPARPGWTGPDLTGTGTGLRGQAAGQPQGPQSNGPRMAALQAFLNRYAPAYSALAVDGWYGTATAAVLAEFAARSGIGGADGLNVGPQLAAALYRAGFERKLSAARARVVGHLARSTRR